MTVRTASVDTVVLDIDGTLLDSTYHHTVAWQRALRAHGYDVPCAHIHRQIGLGGDRLGGRRGRGGGRAPPRRRRSAATWEKEYDTMLDEPGLLPGARGADRRAAGARGQGRAGQLRHPPSRRSRLPPPRGGPRPWTPRRRPTTPRSPSHTRSSWTQPSTRVGGTSSVLVGDSVWDVEAGPSGRHPHHRRPQRRSCPRTILRGAGAAWVFEDAADVLPHLDRVIEPV